MSPDMIRRAMPYLVGMALVIAACLVGWWIHQSGYSAGADGKDQEWSAKWDKQAAELSSAKAKASEAAREEERRRQASIDKVRQDAEQQIAQAESDALAANSAADSLREQARRLAARAGQCTSNPAATQSGTAAAEPGVVLADVLGRADERAGQLAAAYDRARAAGLACERAYDGLLAERVNP